MLKMCLGLYLSLMMIGLPITGSLCAFGVISVEWVMGCILGAMCACGVGITILGVMREN